MNKIELNGPVWLASDVHLGQHTTGTAEAFRDFLKLAASEASALLLPGDIFDAWIGDDVAVVAPPWLAQDLMALKACAAQIPVWLGRGNRDFLNHTAPTAQGWGYAVFGEVVEGQDVIDKMKGVPTANSGFHQNVPTNDVVITKAVVLE